MNPTTTPRFDTAHRRTGASIIAFGVVGLVASTVALIVTRRAMIDLVQVLVIANGLAIGKGSARGVYWGVFLNGWYALVSLALCMVFIARISVTFGARPLTIEEAPWVSLVLLALLAWSTANFIACLRLRRRWRRVERGQCAECGYPIGAGGTCCECGASLP